MHPCACSRVVSASAERYNTFGDLQKGYDHDIYIFRGWDIALVGVDSAMARTLSSLCGC